MVRQGWGTGYSWGRKWVILVGLIKQTVPGLTPAWGKAGGSRRAVEAALKGRQPHSALGLAHASNMVTSTHDHKVEKHSTKINASCSSQGGLPNQPA